ncbi:MAG: SDR family oxidoreductase [Caldilineales bacterium]|nr:SDR family oxidoreductase [Caldilineales bacterium]
MDLMLKGRVAAVAGASKGLGKAVALELAQEGAHVSICSRDGERVRQAAGEIAAASGGQVHAMPIDLSLETECQRFITETVEHFGRLDILIANAGGPPSGPAADFTAEQWQSALNLNLLSTVHLVRAALPHLRRSDQARVIAITSMTAKQPMNNLILSNATRAAVQGFLKSMANEWGHTGITFNALLPGWTQTERVTELVSAISQRRQLPTEEVVAGITSEIPTGRMASPAEFAAAAAFLASGRASFINGVALPVDGGWVRSTF